MKKYRVLSLFSGIGTIDLGLERSGGFETVAFCEIDEHCKRVLNKHWAEVPVFSDINTLTFDKEEGTLSDGSLIRNLSIDVIVGGFPCQDISIAGKQKGLVDENGQPTRSGLWFQYKRLIEEVKPKYVLIENVANLLKQGLATVLKDLCELGYDAEWGVISARDTGAPHLRKRLWLVAYPQGVGNRRNPSELGKKITNPQKQEERTEFKCENENNSRTWGSVEHSGERVLQPKGGTWETATREVRKHWETEPGIRGIHDGGACRIYERHRRQRIKQLGNAVVPQIAQILGEMIIEHRKGYE